MTRIRLPSSLDINCVAAVHGELLVAIDSGVPLEIDGTAVDHIDTAGVQLLLVLHLHAKRFGPAVRISAKSAAIESALSLAGLRDL